MSIVGKKKSLYLPHLDPYLRFYIFLKGAEDCRVSESFSKWSGGLKMEDTRGNLQVVIGHLGKPPGSIGHQGKPPGSIGHLGKPPGSYRTPGETSR